MFHHQYFRIYVQPDGEKKANTLLFKNVIQLSVHDQYSCTPRNRKIDISFYKSCCHVYNHYFSIHVRPVGGK